MLGIAMQHFCFFKQQQVKVCNFFKSSLCIEGLNIPEHLFAYLLDN